MSTDLTNIEQVPSYLQEFVGDAVDNSAYDAPGGSPIAQLSFRGGKWRVRRGPEEKPVPDANGYAAAFVDVIIITANPNIRSKAYYEGNFVDGDNKAPRCAASNGIVPDARIANPIHPICNGCPKDAWRDEIRPDGTKLGGKECKDYKLICVVPLHDPMNEDAPYLVRISPDSLGNFTEYRQMHDKFNPKRALCSSITRLSMDPSTSYPKIVFERMGWIPSEAEPAVKHWLKDPHTKRVLLMDVPAGPGVPGFASPQHIAALEAAQQPTADVIAANQASSAAAQAAAQRVAAIKAASEAAAAKVAPNGHAAAPEPAPLVNPAEFPITPTPEPVAPPPPPPPPPPKTAAPAPVDPALLARREALARAQAQAKAAEEEIRALEAAEAAQAAAAQAQVTIDPVLGNADASSGELLAQLDAEYANIPG